MSAPTIERQTPPGRRTPASPAPGRPRRRWLGVIAGVLAVGLVASAVFLTHYQPLGFGSSGGHFGTTYRQGASFSYAVSLRNNGHLPITITGVDTGDPHSLSLLRTTGIYVLNSIGISRWGNDLAPNLDQPFPSFTLDPGEERNLVVKNVFDGCENYSPSTSEGFGAIHVSFRVLGVSRDTWVDLGHFGFSIASPDACPGRP